MTIAGAGNARRPAVAPGSIRDGAAARLHFNRVQTDVIGRSLYFRAQHSFPEWPHAFATFRQGAHPGEATWNTSSDMLIRTVPIRPELQRWRAHLKSSPGDRWPRRRCSSAPTDCWQPKSNSRSSKAFRPPLSANAAARPRRAPATVLVRQLQAALRAR